MKMCYTLVLAAVLRATAQKRTIKMATKAAAFSAFDSGHSHRLLIRYAVGHQIIALALMLIILPSGQRLGVSNCSSNPGCFACLDLLRKHMTFSARGSYSSKDGTVNRPHYHIRVWKVIPVLNISFWKQLQRPSESAPLKSGSESVRASFSKCASNQPVTSASTFSLPGSFARMCHMWLTNRRVLSSDDACVYRAREPSQSTIVSFSLWNTMNGKFTRCMLRISHPVTRRYSVALRTRVPPW
mmetsp:Transcript_22574/g.67229  ORF Transcript_22574/g.67229 Transcript_22574/m.67229 type:complete len:242 (-) Transcript_22574:779-1504(-)